MRISGIMLVVVSLTIPASLANAQEKEHADAGKVDFLHDVMPQIMKMGCNVSKCHGSTTGKGGLGLSMFGAEPKKDYTTLVKLAAGRRINRVEPAKSLFLLKATESIPHKGGKLLDAGSPEYATLARWVATSAVFIDASRPDLVSLKIAPQKQTIAKGKTQPLQVVAVYSDNSEQNVTADTTFRSTTESVAKVDPNGTVQAVDFGQTCVVAIYMRQTASACIVVPQPLPNPFPEFPPNNKIDELVGAKLKELGLPPSDLCTDPQFLRRVYLDVVGTLPTVDESRAFLADTDHQKRNKLIDRLLASDEFAEYWSLKWGDLFRMKSEYPSNLWPNAVQAYHRWVRDSIKRNKPFDQFARELITSSGSNFRNPPANYYRAFLKREPRNLGEVTALLFMGARVGCARCHGHPEESWSLDDNVGMAAFFAPVQYKRTQEWKEEVVYVNPARTLRNPRTQAVVPPKFLDAETPELKPGVDPRVVFSQWLTSPGNPWFARNITNRTWFWLMGRGIIHEPDDIRSTNPPTNLALIEYLEKELTDHAYDLKHIYRLILNSRTYQLSAKSNEWNNNDVAHFSHYQVKRLGAETLLDAIGHVTERWDTYQSRIPEPFVKMPLGYRATHLADGSIGIPFLELFGRPPRDTAFESDRDQALSMRQTLHILNSSDVQNKINASARIKRLIAEIKEDPKLIEEIYLSTLSRLPTDAEKQGVLNYMSGAGKSLPEGVEAEKTAAEAAAAKAKTDLATATNAYNAAEQAAKQAEAAAKTSARKVQQVAEEMKKVRANAESARQAIREPKSKRDRLINDKVSATDRLAAAVQKFNMAQAEASEEKPVPENVASEKMKAEEALIKVAADLDATEKQLVAAEKTIQKIDAVVNAIVEKRKQADEQNKMAQADAKTKRNAANAAKASRDKLVQAEKSANLKRAAAVKKFYAAKAKLKPNRTQAVQDLVWALFNTKEFLFNH